MGVGRARAIAARLIAAGRERATPVAVIENAARPQARVLKGVLEQLGALVEANAIAGPALLVIGDAAARAEARDGRLPERKIA